ncbi:MAG: hypothetical protein Kow0022_01640 [Phycisphaerales bacterium]
MPWRVEDLSEAVARRLARFEADLAAEQAVHGLDALDEPALHPLIADGLAQLGHHVLREQPYPGPFARRPPHRDRERCDLVALPEGSRTLLDPLALLKARDARQATLFAHADSAPPEGTLPEDAFWLEVKCVAQTNFVDGVPVSNRSYTSQLMRGPAMDLAKLAREPMITAGGSLLLLFGADAGVVRHDLAVMLRGLIDRDLPIASPAIEIVPIADRSGNACVGVCLVPLRAVRDR